MHIGKTPKRIIGLLIFLSIETAHAGTITSTWVGGTGDWSDPVDWISPPGAPLAGYQVLINNTVPLSFVTVDVTTPVLNNVAVASQGNLVVAGNLSAGEFTSFGAITVNGAATLNAGTGGFVQDTATAATSVSAGGSLIDAGTYSQGNGSTLVNGSLSTTLFHVTGGAVTVGGAGVLTIGDGGYTQDLSVTTQINSGGQLNMTGDFSQGNGSTIVNGSLSTALLHVTGGAITVGSGGDLITGSGGYTQGTAGTATTISTGGQINAVGGDFAQETGTTTTVDGLLTADTVNNSGTMDGSGTIDANFNDLGFLEPGDDLAGALTIDGMYFQSGSLDIGIAGPDTNNVLQVDGAASLGGTLDVSQLNGFDPTIGETFLVMTYTSSGGAFNNITDAGLPAGEFWRADYDPNGVSLTLAVSSASTPEAGTLILCGIGVGLVLVGLRGRKQKAIS